MRDPEVDYPAALRRDRSDADDADSDLERRIAARDRRAKAELGKAKLKLGVLLLGFIGVVLWLWLRT